MVCFVSQKTSRNFIVLLEVIALVMFTACHEKTVQSEIVLIADGDSMYLARVTAPYTETDSRIQVYVFNDSVREKVGSWISRSQMLATREKPPGGWGTRQVALQYFWNDAWVYAENVTEFEDHYLVPMNNEKEKSQSERGAFPDSGEALLSISFEKRTSKGKSVL